MNQNLKPQTLFDKIWSNHLVNKQDDGPCLIYIDRHLVHEVTSPQAFEGLRDNKRKVRRPDCTFAVADHNVPTSDRYKGIRNKESRIQVETLEQICKDFDIKTEVHPFSLDNLLKLDLRDLINTDDNGTDAIRLLGQKILRVHLPNLVVESLIFCLACVKLELSPDLGQINNF